MVRETRINPVSAQRLYTPIIIKNSQTHKYTLYAQHINDLLFLIITSAGYLASLMKVPLRALS